MAESGAANGKEQETATQEQDEDYMGDLSKFLPTESSQSSKPKKLPFTGKAFSSSLPSKKKPKIQNWQKQKRLEKERKQSEEDQQTLANMETAIPQSNIGFKLLKQMGYTPGSALGKEGSGRAEPVGLQIRRSRAGIGREDPVKEKARREEEMAERKRRNEEELLQDFGFRQKLQWRSKRVVVNHNKAKAALDQLENREPPIEPDKGEDEEGGSEEEEDEITEEDLLEILVKLRDEHRYCLFCGCQYESAEALLSDCPGIDEDDH